MKPSRCRPEHYASGWQCSGCGYSWGEDGPDECPHEPLADDGLASVCSWMSKGMTLEEIKHALQGALRIAKAQQRHGRDVDAFAEDLWSFIQSHATEPS